MIYLHKKDIIHSDIIIENISINSSGEVKYNNLEEFKIVAELFRQSAVGNYKCWSPERLSREEYSFSADIWSLGVLIIELSTGLHPFIDVIDRAYEILMSCEPPPRIPNNGKFSKELCNFVECCLQINPKDRLSAEQLILHPWILQNKKSGKRFMEWINEIKI